MDTSSPDGDAAAQAGTVLLSDGADGIISVPVAEGVDQVVLNSDQTTYIIQFVDSISDVNPTGDAALVEAAAENIVETNTASVESAAISQAEENVESRFAPVLSSVTSLADQGSQTEQSSKSDSPSKSQDTTTVTKEARVVVEDIKDTLSEKTKTKFGKALNLEPSNTVKAKPVTNNSPSSKENIDTESRKGRTRKKKVDEDYVVEDDDGIYDDEEVILETPRRPNKRSIKKPKRFTDGETSIKKERKTSVITLPPMTKKSVGLKDILVEVEIEESLFVSSLTKSDCVDGLCKYVFRVSRNAISETQDALSEQHDESIEPAQDEVLKEENDDIEEEKEKKPIKVKKKVKKGVKKRKMISILDKAQVEKLSKHKKVARQSEDASEGDTVKSDDENNKQTVDDTDTNIDQDAVNNTDENKDIGHVIKLEETQESVPDTSNTAGSDKETQAEKKFELKYVVEVSKPTKKRGRKKKVKDEDTVKTEDGEETEEAKEEKPKRKYTRRNMYQQDHMNYTTKRTETGKKLFICNICGKECISAANILDHLCVHSNERPAMCRDCGLPFKSEKALQRHSLRHIKKSFICDTCGALFCSGADLKSHASVHSNKREHVCNICGMRFNHSTTLSRHKQVHRVNRIKHVCHICGAIFKRKDGVRRHLNNIHSETDGEVTRPGKSDAKTWFRNRREVPSENLNVTKSKKSISKKSKSTCTDEIIVQNKPDLVPLHGLSDCPTYWTVYKTNSSQVKFPKSVPEPLYYKGSGTDLENLVAEQRQKQKQHQQHEDMSANTVYENNSSHAESGNCYKDTNSVSENYAAEQQQYLQHQQQKHQQLQHEQQQQQQQQQHHENQHHLHEHQQQHQQQDHTDISKNTAYYMGNTSSVSTDQISQAGSVNTSTSQQPMMLQETSGVCAAPSQYTVTHNVDMQTDTGSSQNMAVINTSENVTSTTETSQIFKYLYQNDCVF